MASPQEQIASFLTHCKELRAGYRLKFNKKTSSLKHFIRLLEEFPEGQIPKAQTRQNEIDMMTKLGMANPNDKSRYAPAIKSIYAVWGTDRPYVKLAENQSGERITRYWQTDGNFNDLDQGIAITSTYPGYVEQVRTHLNAIYKTPTGKIMLDKLASATVEKATSIVDHPLSNQCGAMGSIRGMTEVAVELYDDLTTKPGRKTRTALNRAPVGLFENKYAWLADKINNTPRYKLKGVPAVIKADYGITEEMVRTWVDGDRTIWNDFENDPDCNQIKCPSSWRYILTTRKELAPIRWSTTRLAMPTR